MKDSQIQNSLARLMVGGTLIAAAIILAGLIWYLASHVGLKPGDHIFSGEPKYFENPVSMVGRAMDLNEFGHRRSFIMIGVVLLLINPVLRVAFAVLGFAAQRDKLYSAISLFVLGVLLFSFFW
jgi:uncharacterized membrane protein